MRSVFIGFMQLHRTIDVPSRSCTISCNDYIIIYTLPPHIHYGHVSIVVVFEFSDTDKDGSEETGVINVRVVQSVATAVPINLTITPTEYSDDFGFDVTDFDPNSPNIATRTYVCFLPLYYVRYLLKHLAHYQRVGRLSV